MARPRKSAHRNTREKIRRAAIRLFAENGFAGTSTRELCRAARVTKPVLYHYFGGKEELFRQLVTQSLESYREGLLRAAEQRGEARRRLVAVVDNDFFFTRREPELLRLLYRVVFAPEPVVEAEGVVACVEEELRVLEQIAREGVRRRELRGNPREIAVGILGLSHIYTLGWLVQGRPWLTAERARRCVEVILAGCDARPAA